MRLERFFDLLLRHRSLVLGLALTVVLGAGYAARNVKIDYGVEQFFLTWGPERAAYDEYKRLFPGEDTRVSLFWRDDRGPGGDLFHDMRRVAGWFESVGLEDVRWFGNLVVAETDTTLEDAGIVVRHLVDPENVTDASVAAAIRRYGSNRLFDGVFWNRDRTIFLVHGFLRPEDNTDPIRRRIDAVLADSVAALDAPGAEIVLTGLPIARARAPKLLEADIRVLLTGAFVVFATILYWYFRHPIHVIFSLAAVAPAYVVVIGFLGLADRPISILTSFIPIVILVVGMSDAVHLLAAYREERARHADRHPAVTRTFATMAGACFYTSVTTAVGFACLAGTGIDIVVDFGLLTAAAILLTFGFSMTVFPVLVSMVPDPPGHGRNRRGAMIGCMVQAAVSLARQPTWTPLVVTGAVAVLALGLASRLKVDTYLIDDTKASAPFMQDIAWIDRNGFGFFQVNVLLRQTGAAPLHAPSALAWMEDLRAFARRSPLVTHVAGLPDFFRPLRRAVGAARTGDGLPRSLDEASQLLLIAQLHDPESMDEVYREMEGRGQVIITVRDRGSAVVEPFLRELETYLDTHPFPGGSVEVTGSVVMIQSFTRRLLGSFGPSLAVAVVLITGIMIRMFRSVRLGLVAFLPNAFPLVVILGLLSLFGYAIKPSTILVLSIAFGIAVDNTIHLLSRAMRHGNGDVGAGMVAGLRDAGPVMIVTTLIVSGGFLLLVFSHFHVLALVGAMTAASAWAALSADLLVLPALVGLMRARAAVPATIPAPVGGTRR